MVTTDSTTIDKEAWQDKAYAVANGIRRRVLDYTLKNNGGYLSQACSSAEIFATLYTKLMNLGPSAAPMVPLEFKGVPGAGNPHAIRGADYNGALDATHDRFFLSPGHYALVEYAALVEVGRMAPEGLAAFNKDGSTTEMIGADHSPGFEVMSGSLAQALSVAGGVAHARKLNGHPGKVWVFHSDGELEEGQIWEALAAMRHYELDNVTIYVDVNGQQCDGKVCDVMNIEPIVERLESFGAVVASVNGNDVDALVEPTTWEHTGRPLVVLGNTNPHQGLEILERRAPFYHYVRFKSAEERNEYQAAYDQMVLETEGLAK